MVERKTIADSKREFHRSFPYVIPPLYRRIVDELLVELHLLSHQKSFEANILFNLGLVEVFTTFTQGYEPSKHIDKLFESLCKSNGFDGPRIKNESIKMIERVKGQNKDQLKEILLNDESTKFKANSYYSRLCSIGLLGLIKTINDNSSNTLMKDTIDFSESIGLPQKRIEKDLNLFESNFNKLNQALELLEESIKTEKKKREENV